MLASVNLICALLAYSFLAYALARLRWNGRGIALVLLAIIVCAQVWIVPQLISTFVFHTNAILSWIWFTDWLVCAFAIVLLLQSLRETSRDRAEAARLDGCGAFGIYWHVVLPLVRQPLLLLALFIVMGMGCLRLFRMAEISISQPDASLSSIFLFLFEYSAIMTIPLIAIFFLARKLLLPSKIFNQS